MISRTRASFQMGAATITAATMLAAMASEGLAQQNAPVSSIPWSPALKSVVLGSGLEVQPNQISVVGGLGLDSSLYKWQQQSTTFSLLDYSSLSSTISGLHINAWAEANSLFYSGKFSFDFNKYTAVQGNHRHWEVDALQYNTAFLPAPALSALAKGYIADPQNFEAKFGNYGVTQISYVRQITVSFDLEFTSNVSTQSLNTAISGSYGVFTGGVSLTDAFNTLQNLGKTTVTINVTGLSSGMLFSVATQQDLAAITNTVSQILSGWNTPPTDPNSAGNIDTVWVTPYKSVPGGPSVTPGYAPMQNDIADAIAKYVQLEQARQRLIQLQAPGRTFNPKLGAYLFGTTNPNTGIHVAGTGKLDEVTAKRGQVVAYIGNLIAGRTAVLGDVTFQFDDPDVIRWRVAEALTGNTNDWILVEVYSTRQVTAFDPNLPGSGMNYIETRLVSGLFTKFPKLPLFAPYTWWHSFVTDGDSYTNNLDPVTGIPHRFIALHYDCTLHSSRPTVYLRDYASQAVYDAVNFDGSPCPLFLAERGYDDTGIQRVLKDVALDRPSEA